MVLGTFSTFYQKLITKIYNKGIYTFFTGPKVSGNQYFIQGQFKENVPTKWCKS